MIIRLVVRNTQVLFHFRRYANHSVLSVGTSARFFVRSYIPSNLQSSTLPSFLPLPLYSSSDSLFSCNDQANSFRIVRSITFSLQFFLRLLISLPAHFKIFYPSFILFFLASKFPFCILSQYKRSTLKAFFLNRCSVAHKVICFSCLRFLCFTDPCFNLF